MLPSEIAAKVKKLELVTGRQVTDLMAGAYVSVFKGRGIEFDEVRAYVPGDDVRTIDWNVTARMGEPYVKRYVEERELTVMLLVDVSASLDFGSKDRSKREAAAELSALVAFSATQSDDKVGLLLFHGAAEEYIPPRKGKKHALRVIREVLARGDADTPGSPRRRNPFGLPWSVLRRFWRLRKQTAEEPRRATNIANALDFCHRVLPRRTVLFLISDFIDDGYLQILRSANRRHDVVAVMVTDERELSASGKGLVTLEDAERGTTHLVDMGSPAFQDRVKASADDRLKALSLSLRSAGVDLIRIDATQPVVDPLLRFFDQRKRRLAR